MLIFIQPAAPSFKSLININSQLNIYMKEIVSPPPQRTCLKLGLLVAGGSGVSREGRERGWGLAVERLPSVPGPQPATGLCPLPTPSPAEVSLLTPAGPPWSGLPCPLPGPCPE